MLKKGSCKLTLGHIAALAGVCKTTVQNAVRQAVAPLSFRLPFFRLSVCWFHALTEDLLLPGRNWLAGLPAASLSV